MPHEIERRWKKDFHKLLNFIKSKERGVERNILSLVKTIKEEQTDLVNRLPGYTRAGELYKSTVLNASKVPALNYSDKRSMTLFHHAARFGSPATMRILFGGAKENCSPSKINSFDNNGMLPIHHAMKGSNVNTLRFIIKYTAADLNHKAVGGIDGMKIYFANLAYSPSEDATKIAKMKAYLHGADINNDIANRKVPAIAIPRGKLRQPSVADMFRAGALAAAPEIVEMGDDSSPENSPVIRSSNSSAAHRRVFAPESDDSREMSPVSSQSDDLSTMPISRSSSGDYSGAASSSSNSLARSSNSSESLSFRDIAPRRRGQGPWAGLVAPERDPRMRSFFRAQKSCEQGENINPQIRALDEKTSKSILISPRKTRQGALQVLTGLDINTIGKQLESHNKFFRERLAQEGANMKQRSGF